MTEEKVDNLKKIQNISETDVTTIQEMGRLIKENTNVSQVLNYVESKSFSWKTIVYLLKTTFETNFFEKSILIKALINKTKDKNKILSHLIYKNPNIFFKVVSEGDVELLNFILNSNNSFVEIKDSENRNALFYAMNSPFSTKRLEIMSCLIEAGIYLDEVENLEGNTPLTYAACKLLINDVKFLLENNASINHKNNKGLSSLFYAILNNSIELLNIIISDKRSDLSIKDKDGTSAIGLALKLNLTQIYEILIMEISRREEEEKTSSQENEKKIAYNGSKNYEPLFISSKELVKDLKYPQTPLNLNKKLIISDYDKPQVTNSDKKTFNTKAFIEIPFVLKDRGIPLKSRKIKELLTFTSNPTINIDISDTSFSKEKYEASSKYEVEKNKILEELQSYKSENIRLKDEINSKEIKLNSIKEDLKIKDELIKAKINENQLLIEKNNNLLKILDNIEREKYEKSSPKNDLKSNVKPKIALLERKFSQLKYDDKYSSKCLTKDLLDFMELTKEYTSALRDTQEILVGFVQEATNETLLDYEVKLYGSHATNLCLPSSDIDLVLVPNKNNLSTIYPFSALQKLYFNICEKSWKKSVKFIDNTTIPILKIIGSDQYKNMQIDISIQDQKHYGLKCVELIRSFLKEYEVLQPLVFALKNVLKYAQLNDPYTGGLSSYGLILMVVSFLQMQIENNKSTSISDLGSIFLEFLWYYGFSFDYTKNIVYTDIPGEMNYNEKYEIYAYYNTYQPNHDLIIVDPINKTNNVGKSTFQYINIKMAFMISFVVAHEDCECGCHFNRDLPLQINNEHCILKRIFLSVKRFNSSPSNQL